jgi:glycine betaine/proline transport system substrate-binding protein
MRGGFGVTGAIRGLVALVLIGLFGAGCTTSNDGARQVEQAATEGMPIKPARATWSSGYFQAAIYTELLRELGSRVLDESAEELSPDLFYPAVALGEVDYWVNGWFPDANGALDTDLVTGGTVGDLATPVGFEVRSGGVQGFLIDKASADTHDIESMRQIVESDELRQLFDVNDDGTADISGCNQGWNCARVVEETILRNEWGDRLTQIQDDYDALFRDVVDRVRAGEPVLYFAWTPNYTSAQLVAGSDVVWLGLGGDPVPGQEDPTDLPDGECAADPCRTGFAPSDIRVVANREFLRRNPQIAGLFEVVEIPVADIAQQNFEMLNGADTQADINEAAKRWIEDHRVRVDAWLESARRQVDV